MYVYMYILFPSFGVVCTCKFHVPTEMVRAVLKSSDAHENILEK